MYSDYQSMDAMGPFWFVVPNIQLLKFWPEPWVVMVAITCLAVIRDEKVALKRLWACAFCCLGKVQLHVDSVLRVTWGCLSCMG